MKRNTIFPWWQIANKMLLLLVQVNNVKLHIFGTFFCICWHELSIIIMDYFNMYLFWFNRVLIWSLAPIVEARVRLDESQSWLVLSHVEGPLYVTKWNAERYADGIHSLVVRSLMFAIDIVLSMLICFFVYHWLWVHVLPTVFLGELC